jgi:TolA-binding protein
VLESRNRAIAAYNHGLEKAQTGDLAGASEALEEALREDPMHIEARNVLGKVYLHMGEPKQAERCWQRVLLVDPDNFTARECLDALRGRTGRFNISTRHLFILGGVCIFLVLFGIIYLHLQDVNQSVQTKYAQLETQLQQLQKESTPPATPSKSPTTVNQKEGPATPIVPASEPRPPVTKPGVGAEKLPPAAVREEKASPLSAVAPVKKNSAPVAEKRSADKGAGSMAAYKQAVAQAFAAHYDQAILMFLDLAKDPGLPYDLKDNVHFWLGHCYVGKRQYESGLVHYMTVIKEYPEGNKRPEAVVGAADCYAQLGRYDQAVPLLRALLDERPSGLNLKPVQEKLRKYSAAPGQEKKSEEQKRIGPSAVRGAKREG